MLTPWKKCYDQPRQHIKKQRHYFTNKGPSSQSSVCLFPVVIYRCESSTIKKAELRRIHGFELWCWRRLLRVLWTARISKESYLKEIHPEYSLKGLYWSWNSNIWPPDAQNWLIWKDPDAGKDRRWEVKGTTEDEMVGWHHWLNGREFE